MELAESEVNNIWASLTSTHLNEDSDVRRLGEILDNSEINVLMNLVCKIVTDIAQESFEMGQEHRRNSGG